MINSRAKGCRGELEWSAFLREHLSCPDARRGQQFSGSPESPDVVGGVPGTHCEAKRTERLNLQAAMEQAVQDCGDDIPYVASRRSRKPWLVTVQADDLAAFCQAVVTHLDGDKLGPLIRQVSAAAQLAGYASTCQEINTPNWMDGLQQRLKAVTVSNDTLSDQVSPESGDSDA